MFREFPGFIGYLGVGSIRNNPDVRLAARSLEEFPPGVGKWITYI